MDGTGKKKGYGSALDKALAILEHVTAHPQAVGLPDLSERLDMPRQTVHRTLLQMEELGLIIRDPTRDRFYVGQRLTHLATSALFSENHNMPTRVILQDLVDDIGESCNIGVLDGLDFVYLDRIQTQSSLRVHLEAGTHVPAHATSGGKILLAFLPNRLRDKLIRLKTLPRYTDTTITDPDALECELAACREKGYAINNQESENGIVGIAMPVQDDKGQVIAAIACHAPLARVTLADLETFIPRMQSSAEKLGRYWV